MKHALVLSTWMMLVPAVFGTALSATGCASSGRTISTIDPSATPKPIKAPSATSVGKPLNELRAAPGALERRGCCSGHGGVCGCDGGFVGCCDGTASQACGCD